MEHSNVVSSVSRRYNSTKLDIVYVAKGSCQEQKRKMSDGESDGRSGRAHPRYHMPASRKPHAVAKEMARGFVPVNVAAALAKVRIASSLGYVPADSKQEACQGACRGEPRACEAGLE